MNALSLLKEIRQFLLELPSQQEGPWLGAPVAPEGASFGSTRGTKSGSQQNQKVILRGHMSSFGICLYTAYKPLQKP